MVVMMNTAHVFTVAHPAIAHVLSDVGPMAIVAGAAEAVTLVATRTAVPVSMSTSTMEATGATALSSSVVSAMVVCAGTESTN